MVEEQSPWVMPLAIGGWLTAACIAAAWMILPGPIAPSSPAASAPTPIEPAEAAPIHAAEPPVEPEVVANETPAPPPVALSSDFGGPVRPPSLWSDAPASEPDPEAPLPILPPTHIEVQSTWDKLDDNTLVHVDLGVVPCREPNGPPLTLTLQVKFDGRVPRNVDEIDLYAHALSGPDDPYWFDEHAAFIMRANGARLQLSRKYPSSRPTWSHMPESSRDIAEYAFFVLSRTDVGIIATAEELTCTVGRWNFTFTDEQREAMRDFASKLAPAP